MISVVVPIYNEEELIVRFHEAVASFPWKALTQAMGSSVCKRWLHRISLLIC
jgi:hypothetical protein